MSAFSFSPAFLKAKIFQLDLFTEGAALEDFVAWVLPQLGSSVSQRSFFAGTPPDLRLIFENILAAPQDYISVPLSRSKVDELPKRYNPLGVRAGALSSWLRQLQDLGWIELHLGQRHESVSYQTRFRATAVLRAILIDALGENFQPRRCGAREVLLLRQKTPDGSRHLKDYAETEQTFHWRENLKNINAFLKKQSVTLRGQKIETHTRRIFSGDFERGGRFYAPYQQLSQQDRSELHINAQPCVEYDFVSLHISMLYLLKTKELCPGDAYDIAGLERPVAKKLVNTLLNCVHRADAEQSVAATLWKEGLNIAAVTIIDLILAKHAPVRESFFCGEGLKLQKLDSEIAETIFLTGLQDGIPVLGIHDSFLVRGPHGEWLLNTMGAAAAKLCGASLPIRTKSSKVSAA